MNVNVTDNDNVYHKLSTEVKELSDYQKQINNSLDNSSRLLYFLRDELSFLSDLIQNENTNDTNLNLMMTLHYRINHVSANITFIEKDYKMNQKKHLEIQYCLDNLKSKLRDHIYNLK